MKILFSGFEPFGDDIINPSLEAVKQLKTKAIDGVELLTVQTPVVKQVSIDTVTAAIEQHQPDVVVTVGQAGGRMTITPERVAINVDDYRIKDNEGFQPIDEPVVSGAPAAYFSTLPIKAMVKAMQDKNIPAAISNSAGTFVCNHLFYGVQHYIVSHDLPIRHGFIHIPLIPEQSVDGTQPTMDLAVIVDGLVTIAEAIRDNASDIKSGAGKIC